MTHNVEVPATDEIKNGAGYRVWIEPWYERYATRFSEERSVLEDLGYHLQSMEPVTFTRDNGNDGSSLKIVLPSTFPSSAPQIYLEGSILPRHHRPDSSLLCLFGYDEERWSAELTVRDALQEAEAIIRLNRTIRGNNQPYDEDEGPEPVVNYFPYATVQFNEDIHCEKVLIIPPSLIDVDINGQIFFHWYRGASAQGPFYLGIALGIVGENGEKELRPVDEIVTLNLPPGGLILNGKFRRRIGAHPQFFSAHYIQLTETPPPWQNEQEYDEWLQHSDLPTLSSSLVCYRFLDEYKNTGRYIPSWTLVRRSSSTFEVTRCYPIRNSFERIPQLAPISETRALIVGLGALGSRVAIQLAKVGIGCLDLVDPKRVSPGVLVRQPYQIKHLGLPKPAALSDIIRLQAPYMAPKLKLAPAPISPEILNALYGDAAPHVIVDCTANRRASHFLNDISTLKGIPAVYSWTVNAEWGVVLRYKPGQSGCYRCWETQFHDEPPFDAREIFFDGCDQPSFAGTDYDLGAIASLTTRIVVDALLRKTNDSYTASRWIWRVKDKNEEPDLHTNMDIVRPVRDCPWCGDQ